MKLLKLLGIVFLSLLCLGSGFAVTDEDLRSGIKAYWTFDENEGTTAFDSVGSNDFTLNSDAWGDGKINSGFDSNDQYSINTGFRLDDYNTFSLSGWFKYVSGDKYILGERRSTGRRNFHLRIDDGHLLSQMRDGDYITDDSQDFRDGNFHHFVMIRDGSTHYLYVNGQLVGSGSVGSRSSTDNLFIGADGYDSNNFGGVIDEIAMWDEAKTSDEVEELYNRQSQELSNAQYDFTSAPAIEADVQDFYSSNNITLNLTTNPIWNTNMSYILDNLSETSICNNCNTSTLELTNLSEGSHSIVFVSEDENYQVNSSYDFTIDTTDPTITNNIEDEINSYYLDSLNFSCSDDNLDVCEIHINNQTKNPSDNITFSRNGEIDYTIYAEDEAGNTATENGNIFVNPLQRFQFQDKDNNIVNNFTFDGIEYEDYVEFPLYDLGLGEHTLLFEKLGFSSQNFTFEFDTTSDFNQTFNVSESKIVVTIRDRETRNIIDDREIKLDLINSFGIEETTSTGKINISNINFVPGQHHIIARADGYATGVNYFEFDNQETVNVDFWLLNQSSDNFGTIELNVQDQFSQFISGAICEAQEWRSAESSYVTVTEGITNSNGNVFLDIELNAKEYRFKCSKQGISSTTTSEIIGTDLEVRNVRLAESQEQIISDLSGLTYSITENVSQNLSSINFDYTDENKEVIRGCITYYNTAGIGRNQLARTCSNSSSASIQQSFLINNSFPLQAEISVFTNQNKYVLETFRYEGFNSLTGFLKSYNLDFFLPFLLVLLGIALGLFLGNIYISVVGVIIGIWIAFILVPFIITGVVATSITIIAGLILWGAYRIR